MADKRLNNLKYTRYMLQIGLAAVFLYAAIGSLSQPASWTAFLPTFLINLIAPAILLKIFAIFELLLATWLLSGLYLKMAGLICAMTLAGIILSNPGQLIITFRDIGLLFMAAALIFIPESSNK